MQNDSRIFWHKDTVWRMLEKRGGEILVIDCMRKTMPKWMDLSELKEASEISEGEFYTELGFQPDRQLSASERKIMRERFLVIAGILPFVGEKRKRSYLISAAAEKYAVSKNTVKNYLAAYLVFQDVAALAPREKEQRTELTPDEKNMRWALNKFYYTKEKQSLATAYTMLLKEKYCDREGKLCGSYPSIHQFRYFYEKTKKLQTYYISRGGIKDYQKNHRPLTGGGMETYSSVGIGMLDGTVCDIYLVDEAGHLAGRPILLACVDAYSSFCYGYSLLWEGGVYSLRSLMLNVITDKVKWCQKFGIQIKKEQWDNTQLPGTMMTDMGTEYTSGNFEQIAELGVTLLNLPAYRPELKGRVEKFFDLVQAEFKKHLKGKGVIEPDYRERGAHDYRKDACLTMKDFEKIILRCIVYYNSGRLMEKFPYTKEMLQSDIRPYASSVFAWGKTMPSADLLSVTKKELLLTLLPRTKGRFTRAGLRVNGLRYHAEGHTEEYLRGGEAVAAYNPEDVSRIWLVQDGRYEVFELIEWRFYGKDLAAAEALKAECGKLIKNAAVENLQAKIDLANHINGIAGVSVGTQDTNLKNIRTTRKREQRKRHLDFMKDGVEDA